MISDSTAGLGTWYGRQTSTDEVERAVLAALAAGYRHIDTAFAYGCEPEIGSAIRASGIPRSEIFLTTKLTPSSLSRVEEGLTASLKNLGVDYIDLYLVHWPISVDPNDSTKTTHPDWTFVDAWREMQKLPASGRVRSIGVSNFQIEHLETLLSAPSTTVVPAVNQIELHPQCPSPKLVAYNASKGIHTTGYANLGGIPGKLREDPNVLDVMKSTGKSVAQVLLKWGLQKEWSVIPKSSNEERIRGNFDLDGWDLTEEEVKKLDGIEKRFRIYDGVGLFPEVSKFTDDE